jgi:hypothetical protein
VQLAPTPAKAGRVSGVEVAPLGAPLQISEDIRRGALRERAEGLERDGVPPLGARWHETTVRRLIDQENRAE